MVVRAVPAEASSRWKRPGRPHNRSQRHRISKEADMPGCFIEVDPQAGVLLSRSISPRSTKRRVFDVVPPALTDRRSTACQ